MLAKTAIRKEASQVSLSFFLVVSSQTGIPGSILQTSFANGSAKNDVKKFNAMPTYLHTCGTSLLNCIKKDMS